MKMKQYFIIINFSSLGELDINGTAIINSAYDSRLFSNNRAKMRGKVCI